MGSAEHLDLVVRSRRLHARRFGSPSDPLVLVVHGLTGDSRAFDMLAEQLGVGLQLVALDLHGRGGSETTPPGTYGWENHALDLFAVADRLGCERFSIVGQSMGGSVAMKAAELGAPRLDAIVLVDVAGRVDPGVGAVVDEVVRQAHSAAVDEDRRYGATQDPYARWQHLTMPTLLLRATRELTPGSGLVVPARDADLFRQRVPHSMVVEIDADHRTIADDPHAAQVVGDFLREVAR